LIALDTSALTELVVHEAETSAFVRALHGQRVTASDLVRTELGRAVLRAVPERLPDVGRILDRLLLVRLDGGILDDAGRLVPRSLRSLDAIHFPCAPALGDELDAFITYDARQAEAARAAGLRVLASA
jgi:uncharacterized protein